MATLNDTTEFNYDPNLNLNTVFNDTEINGAQECNYYNLFYNEFA